MSIPEALTTEQAQGESLPATAPTTAEGVGGIDAFRALIGQKALRSQWLTIDQSMIDAFAALTRDMNPLHVDPIAARDGPFGAPIAHGFLVLSMLSSFVNEMTGLPKSAKAAVNRGFNRIRFMTPLPAGGRIRNRMTITEVRPVGPDMFIVSSHNTVEIAGNPTPALVAEWEFIVYV